MNGRLPSWMRDTRLKDAPIRRGGVVARIRVNPRDCLSILDILQSNGIDIQGMSFSAITSLAMTCMLESLRKGEVIPRNDGFDYNERMGPYLEGKSTSDKSGLTGGLYMKAVQGESLPEIQINGRQERSVGEMSAEELLEEYHKLKHSQLPKDRSRVIQIQDRVADKLNEERT